MANKKVTKKVTKKRVKKNVEHGQAHIQSSFNNTIVTLTDAEGNALSWASAGGLGFKGSRKSTPYAAQMAAETATKAALIHGLKTVDVFVKGPGSGREAAIRALSACGLDVVSIKDLVSRLPSFVTLPPFPTTAAARPSVVAFNRRFAESDREAPGFRWLLHIPIVGIDTNQK